MIDYENITSYVEFDKLSYKDKLKYQLFWQEQFENGHEIEYLLKNTRVWETKHKNLNCGFNVLYRFKEIDFEKISTLEQLRSLHPTLKAKYKNYWQKLLDNGVAIEFLNCTKNDKWTDKDIQDPCIDFNIYRRKPTKKIVPLDFSDIPNILFKPLINTLSKQRCYVSQYHFKEGGEERVLKITFEFTKKWISFESLQEIYTTIDGKKLQKEVEL